jgi:hypothetical protein
MVGMSMCRDHDIESRLSVGRTFTDDVLHDVADASGTWTTRVHAAVEKNAALALRRG